MLNWRELKPGDVLYDEFRPGTQLLAEHISGAFRLTGSGGDWELSEYERRSGAGYRMLVVTRFATRETAVDYAAGILAQAGARTPG